MDNSNSNLNLNELIVQCELLNHISSNLVSINRLKYLANVDSLFQILIRYFVEFIADLFKIVTSLFYAH
jgi:hypothetical protein